jgi:hypothetical protein
MARKKKTKPKATKFAKIKLEDAALMSPYEFEGRIADELLAKQENKSKRKKRKTND